MNVHDVRMIIKRKAEADYLNSCLLPVRLQRNVNYLIIIRSQLAIYLIYKPWLVGVFDKYTTRV